MERHELLRRIAADEEERLLLGRIWDKYRQCAERAIPTHTVFLSPAQQQAAQKLLCAIGAHQEEYVFSGGFAGAGRQMLHFLPPWAEEPDLSCLCAVGCRWYEGDTLSHRDLLGSLMGLGLTRESLGDILVEESAHSAAAVLAAGVRDCVLSQWDKAGRVALQTVPLPLREITVPVIQVRQVRDTVSSLRLDNVTAAAFSLSRGKASEAVESGRVQLDGAVCLKGEKTVAQGQEISLRGLGKCRLTAVGAANRKGRFGVVIERYL